MAANFLPKKKVKDFPKFSAPFETVCHDILNAAIFNSAGMRIKIPG